jgi:alpha-beta hydrolase superfamily lysophospholipase
LTMSLLANIASAQSQTDFDCTAARASGDDPAIVATTLGDTPALIRMPKRISMPPILLWHGFGPPDSEQTLMDALPLDAVPAVKIYLGLPLFGTRKDVDLARRQREDLATLVFEPVVMGAAKELPSVVRALEQRSCLESGERIGLFGFSAGGAAVLYALAEADVPVGAAVILNASTGLTASVKAYELATKGSYTWTEAARRLARRSDAVSRAKDIVSGSPPPALSIMHGGDDAMLTPQSATTLHQALQPLYRAAQAPQRLQLTVVPGLAHAWIGTGNVEALRSSIAAWFHTYLASTGQPAA